MLEHEGVVFVVELGCDLTVGVRKGFEQRLHAGTASGDVASFV